MAARLDTSPERRLRQLAASLQLSSSDVEQALANSRGDLDAAERLLRDAVGKKNNASTTAVHSAATTRAASVALTREERIRKTANALARTPDALDLLHASLTKVLDNPHAERCRKVNVSAGVFRERVAAKNPAGVELLFAVGYEPMHGHLVLQRFDAATLRLALGALVAARGLAAYREAKAAAQAAQAAARDAAQAAAAAAAHRAALLAKVPAEPKDGDGHSACVITVKVGEQRTTRRFESDNTLDDLVNFIRSLPAVPVDAGALAVDNVTTRPARALDAARQGTMSLYALDLWPRGQVQVEVAA